MKPSLVSHSSVTRASCHLLSIISIGRQVSGKECDISFWSLSVLFNSQTINTSSIFTSKDHLLLLQLRVVRVGQILICVYNTNKDNLLLLRSPLILPGKDHHLLLTNKTLLRVLRDERSSRFSRMKTTSSSSFVFTTLIKTGSSSSSSNLIYKCVAELATFRGCTKRGRARSVVWRHRHALNEASTRFNSLASAACSASNSHADVAAYPSPVSEAQRCSGG